MRVSCVLNGWFSALTVHSLQAYVYNMIYLFILLQRVVSFGSVSTSLRLVNPLKE